MNYFGITGLLNGIISTILGLFVITRDFRNVKYIAYSLACLNVSIWSYSYFLWQLSNDYVSALFWARALMAGSVYTPICHLHALVEILNEKTRKRQKIIILGYLLATLLLISDFGPFLVKGVESRMFFPFWPIPGIAFHFFIAVWVYYVVYSIYILYKHSFKIQVADANKIKFIFIITLFVWIGAATNLTLWYNINIPPWGNPAISIYLILIAYAILRYRWMDIEVVIKKTLVFAGLLAAVFAILILPTLIIQEYLLRSARFSGRALGLTVSGIIIIFTMRKIENFLINVTDKYLFQKKYDYKELLKTFTTDVLTVMNLDRLVNLTVDKLVDIVKLNSCAVLLLDEDSRQFTVVASKHIKDPSVTLVKPNGIIAFLETTHGYLLKSELAQKKVFIPEPVQEVIDKLNAELIIPMVLHDKVMGILSLGKKKSDEGYTQDDWDILMPLSRTLAIAISNAKLFEELGKTQAEAAQREKMAVIGTLSAGINHEICNPLGIARGQCEAFLLNVRDGLFKDKSPDELLTKAKEIMQKVIKETDRAVSITKKLSSFAKPSRGEAEYIVIDKEVDEVLALVGYELKLEKIEIEKQVGKGLPDLFVDRKQLQEILFNLIRNAGQAIGEKGKITVAAHELKGKISIDIQDTGSGIPEDKIKELFNPFFTTKEPGKGTGLGLFIVRQVVEKNGGRIYLKQTKVGEGTTFTLEFPVAAAKEVQV